MRENRINHFNSNHDDSVQEIRDFNRDVGEREISGLESLRAKPENFSDVYPPEEIKKDLTYVEEKEDKYRKSLENKTQNDLRIEEREAENRDRDKAAEYITIEAIYRGNWLDRQGYEIFVKPTSKFDDYYKGIDLEVAFRKKKDEDWIYLGIDVTTTQSAKNAKDKINRTKEDIRERGYSYVKYHQPDKKSKEKKGLLQMPRVVIGYYNQEELLNLVRIQQGKIPGKTLEDSPLQIEFRQEILDQLIISLYHLVEGSRNYGKVEMPQTAEEALKINLSSLPVNKRKFAVKIQEAIEFIQGVRQEKNPSEQISPERAMDPVLQELAPLGTKKSLAAF